MNQPVQDIEHEGPLPVRHLAIIFHEKAGDRFGELLPAFDRFVAGNLQEFSCVQFWRFFLDPITALILQPKLELFQEPTKSYMVYLPDFSRLIRTGLIITTYI